MGTRTDQDSPATAEPGPLRPRRRPVAFGRALIGGLLVSSAVVGGFVLAQPQPLPPLPTYVAAAADIDTGDRIRASDLTIVSASLPDRSLTTAATSADAVAGAIALAPIHRGEVIDERDVAHDPVVGGQSVPEIHQVTIPVSSERIPPSVARGDYVTVLAFDDERERSIVVLEHVLVLDTDADREGLGRASQRQLTLAVPDATAAIDMVTWSYAALDIVLTNGVLEPNGPGLIAGNTHLSEEVSR